MEPIIIKEVQVGGAKYLATPELVLFPKLDSDGWLCVEEPSLSLIVSNQTIDGLREDVVAECNFLIKEYVRDNTESFAEDALVLRDNLMSRFSKKS
jgi:hypothetical protein